MAHTYTHDNAITNRVKGRWGFQGEMPWKIISAPMLLSVGHVYEHSSETSNGSVLIQYATRQIVTVSLLLEATVMVCIFLVWKVPEPLGWRRFCWNGLQINREWPLNTNIRTYTDTHIYVQSDTNRTTRSHKQWRYSCGQQMHALLLFVTIKNVLSKRMKFDSDQKAAALQVSYYETQLVLTSWHEQRLAVRQDWR